MFSKSVVLRLHCWIILLSLSSASWAADELFRAAKSYESGGIWATSVAVADVNGDGKPDLLVANLCGNDPNCLEVGSVGVLLGNGDESFQAALSYESGGYQPMSLAVGDVNGDGKLDLLVANSCETEITQCDIGVVGVLLGNGDGTFQTAVGYGTSGYDATSIAVADVNRDGKLDLVVANNCAGAGSCDHGSLAVLLGNGDGTFQAAQLYNSGGAEVSYVAAKDVNSDGRLDLIAANAGNGVAVLLGNGDGTFQTARIYSSGDYSPHSIAIEDVNGDGNPDLLVANECADSYCRHGSAGVLLGNGDGTFQAAVTYNSSGIWPFSIAVGDVNGDGQPDLLLTNECFSECDSSIVDLLLGNGDGTFQTPQQYKSGGKDAIYVALVDVNGDGKLDAVVANHIGGVGVLLNSTGLPATTTTLVSSRNPSALGRPVTFSATVNSPVGAPPNGEVVTFYDGSGALGTAPLNGGVASLVTSSLSVGEHIITASYGGDSNFTASTSAPLTQVVVRLTVVWPPHR